MYGIFTYISTIHVGKYTSPMDPMGNGGSSLLWNKNWLNLRGVRSFGSVKQMTSRLRRRLTRRQGKACSGLFVLSFIVSFFKNSPRQVFFSRTLGLQSFFVVDVFCFCFGEAISIYNVAITSNTCIVNVFLKLSTMPMNQ